MSGESPTLVSFWLEPGAVAVSIVHRLVADTMGD